MKKFKNSLLLLLVGAVFLTFALGSSSSDGEEGTSTGKEDFQLIEKKGYSDKSGFAYYVEGKLKNTTDKKYSYVQVTFKVYDKDGAVIGSCLDTQNDIAGGETWKFKAICSGNAKSVKSFKYTGYTAY